jgi:anaerobic magnesium-protoporphyrin IX monomethyl ester cyclase
MAHVALAYPPMANPYAPYLSVPELAANLRAAGHQVTSLDLNVEAHDYLLTRKELERAFQPLVQRFMELERQHSMLTVQEQQEYARLAGPIARCEFLCNEIDRVVAELRDARFYTFDESGESRQTLNWSLFTQARLLLFTSRVFNPFLYEGYDGGISCFMSRDHVLAAIDAKGDSPIHHFYRMSVMPRLKELNPDILGISWTFAEQTVPTFLLAAMVKKEMPGTRVVLGGNIPSLLHAELTRAEPLHDFIDGFCVGDGEPTLREMAMQVDAGGWDPRIIPNFRFCSNGTVQQSLRTEKWRIADDPPPDFDGLPLDQYFVGTRQLVYMTGRGCYYNKCKFCNFPATKPGYQDRSPEKVAADLDYLANRYNTRLFYIADDAVAPTKTYKIATEILARSLDITWWVLTRYDAGWTPDRLQTIKQAGCYRLFFGGESADDRLQKYTDKGFNSERIREVLRMLRGTGLHVHMSTIVGFPTELPHETDNTIAMVKQEMRSVGFSGRVHIFRLTAYSGLAADPSCGVQALMHPLNELAVNYAYYRVHTLKENAHDKTCDLANDTQLVQLSLDPNAHTRKDADNRPIAYSEPGSLREMLAAKEKAKEKINAFNREERFVKLHCYPETHTYEGLQFCANYDGAVPDTPVPQPSPSPDNCQPRVAPWVTTYEFRFPVDFIADQYRQFLRESEIMAFEEGVSLEEGERHYESVFFQDVGPDPVLAVINHKTEDRRYLDPRAADLLRLCDGTRTGHEILCDYFSQHPEDGLSQDVRAIVEALIADLLTFGFLLAGTSNPDGLVSSQILPSIIVGPDASQTTVL